MQKRLLICAIALLALLAAVCFAASAETSGTCGVYGDNLTWTLDDEGTLTISGSGEMYDYYSGQGPWGTGIKTAVIESGITSIGYGALSGCTSLTSVTIPGSVTIIGNYAFQNCTGLTSVTIPGSVTSIGSHAFQYCTGLTSVTIPDSVTSIGDCAFYGCTGLTSVTILEGVTSIGGYAFSGCTGLTSVTIPDGVTSIGYNAFYNCTGLTSVTIPDSVTSIGDCAFYGCTVLSVTIPDSVTSIGYDAFSGVNMIYAHLGTDGAKALGKVGHSFREPSAAFNLRYVYENNSIVGLEISQVDQDVVGFTIPDSVTSIGYSAFSGCTGLTSVTIPEGVTSIGSYAFQNCTGLTSVTIPGSVTSIGDYAFYGCTSLASVTIPESVTSIGIYAFTGCNGLTSAFILGDAVTFGYDVFSTWSRPTIYCYEFTDVDYWATDNGYTVVYLDDLNPASMRTVTLPADFRMVVGDTRRLNAVVFPDYDKPVVTWTSSDPEVVSVEGGLLTALKKGSATITATVDGATASVNVDVYIDATSFELNTAEAWLVAKETLQLSVASLEPEGSEAALSWSSADTSLATVDADGLVTTKKPGDVVISADSARGIHREALLHIFYRVTAIAFEGDTFQLDRGDTLQLTANVTANTQSCVNHLVTFTSDDEGVATVSPEGVVTGVARGTAVITAAAANGVSASVNVTVVDDDPYGHPWNIPTYAWSADNASVTATRACSNGGAHVETETVAVNYVVTASPTPDAMGEVTYTATFENPVFEVQTKTANIPALNDMSLLVLPEHIDAIEDEAFCGTDCEGVIIPDGCTTIGSRAFADCARLIYVRIPASVTSVAADAFEGSGNVRLDYME